MGQKGSILLKMNPTNIKEKGSECLQSNSNNLISAVQEGRLDVVKELVKSFGPSYLKEWPEGNQLLRDALCTDRDIAKVLLLNGSKVNNNHDFSFTPLHFAAIYGDTEIVKMLLDRNAKIDAKDTRGRTALHHAIAENEIKTIKLLLNRKACVNACDREGRTPLHYAIETGREEVINLLLQYNPDVNINADCGTPLYIAIAEGKLQIVSDLLDRGASVNAVCASTGYTPLHLAAVEGKLEVARLLLPKGADVNAVAKGNLFPLYLATRAGHKTTVKLLLEHGAFVDAHNEDGRTALCCAVERGYSDIVNEILKCSPHPSNESNRSSLYFAIQKNRRKILESLVEHGFGVSPKDIHDCELLYSVVKFGYLLIAENLVRYGANVNVKPKSKARHTLLHTATIYKQEKMVQYLIKCGANVNAEDADNRTPLFYAVQNGDLTIAKLFLANGTDLKNSIELLNTAVTKGCIEMVKILLQFFSDIDINRKDKLGRTPLYCTVLSPRHSAVNGDIAKLLLSKGASIDISTRNGIPILHDAVRNEDVKLVEVLLDNNVDVNSVVDEETALYISAQRGYEVITRMLLNKGAMVNAKREDGTTALHVAADMGHAKIVEMLLEYGADVNCRALGDSTPLHVAATNPLGIANILIKYGADVDAIDVYGRTALHIACRLGHKSTMVALLQNGSDINIMGEDKAIDFALTYTDLFIQQGPASVQFYDTVNAEMIVRHIVKLIANKSFVNETYLNTINANPDLKHFYDSCEREIQEMRNEKIYNTSVSFYSILMKGVHQLAIYAENESIVEAFESTKCAEMFPIYSDVLEDQLKKGQERQRLVKSGIKSISFLSGYDLPHFLINNKIFSYLNNLDLKKLIKASPCHICDEISANK